MFTFYIYISEAPIYLNLRKFSKSVSFINSTCTAKKIRFIYSQKLNCASSFPTIFMYLWAIYISPRLVHLFFCSKISRPIVIIILIAHRFRNVGIGNGTAQFHFWDFCICFEFSVQCLCSVASVVRSDDSGRLFIYHRSRISNEEFCLILLSFYSTLHLHLLSLLTVCIMVKPPPAIHRERKVGGPWLSYLKGRGDGPSLNDSKRTSLLFTYVFHLYSHS